MTTPDDPLTSAVNVIGRAIERGGEADQLFVASLDRSDPENHVLVICKVTPDRPQFVASLTANLTAPPDHAAVVPAPSEHPEPPEQQSG